MWEEHLKSCLAEAQAEDNPDLSGWQVIVDMVRMVFEKGELAAEFTWATVILLTQGGIEYRVIVLVEVIRKVVSITIEWHLDDSI